MTLAVERLIDGQWVALNDGSSVQNEYQAINDATNRLTALSEAKYCKKGSK